MTDTLTVRMNKDETYSTIINCLNDKVKMNYFNKISFSLLINGEEYYIESNMSQIIRTNT